MQSQTSLKQLLRIAVNSHKDCGSKGVIFFHDSEDEVSEQITERS